MAQPQQTGERGERRLYDLLRFRYGLRVQKMGSRHAFDFLVDGVHRVEVKTAMPQTVDGRLIWRANIQRHGLLSETADLYILRLEGVPYSKAAIHLLLRAPIGAKAVEVSFRSLLGRHSGAVADFYSFAKGQYRLAGKVAA